MTYTSAIVGMSQTWYKVGAPFRSNGIAPLTTVRDDLIMAVTVLAPAWLAYKVTHTATGRSYIGITAQGMAVRRQQHVYDANRRDSRRRGALHNAIRKCGADAFTFEIMQDGMSLVEACLTERRLIAEYDTVRPHGFNLTSGGEMTTGITHSGETKARNRLRWEDHDFRDRALAGLRRNEQWAGLGHEKRRAGAAERLAERNRQRGMAIREVRAVEALLPQPQKQKKQRASETSLTCAKKSAASKAYWERRRESVASGEIERVGHATHRHTAESRAKLSISMAAVWDARRRTSSGAAS